MSCLNECMYGWGRYYPTNAPLLVLNNELLDFDEVPVETTVIRSVRVLNSGQAMLDVTAVSYEGDEVQAFTINEESFSVNGEASVYLNVSFRPTEIKDFEATLTFESNSSDDKGQTITLLGKGVSATICGECDNPPESSCLSETTLLLYDNRGTCVNGACEYHARTVECESGCNDETGRCNDDEGNAPAPPDRDDDGVPDATDPCPDEPNTEDPDGDGVCADDNCPNDANPDQVDADGDGLGNVCDPCPTEEANDQDEDGICESVDNCDLVANPDQANTDGDAAGDACDLCPELPAREHLDLNNNGVGDGCEFQLAMTHYQACALSDDGTIECWGAENDILTCATPGACGEGSPGVPSNAVQIALGRQHGCAVVEGGAIECWGTGTGAVAPDGLLLEGIVQ